MHDYFSRLRSRRHAHQCVLSWNDRQWSQNKSDSRCSRQQNTLIVSCKHDGACVALERKKYLDFLAWKYFELDEGFKLISATLPSVKQYVFFHEGTVTNHPPFFCLIKSTCYSKHLGAKTFEFAWILDFLCPLKIALEVLHDRILGSLGRQLLMTST